MKTIYWHGDRASYTGRTEELHGAVFHEIKMMEGHLKGILKLTQRAPRPTDSEEVNNETQ